MKAVIINGEESNIRTEGLNTIGDLVELIKNVIDPEHMITGLLLDGNELKDTDWTNNLHNYENCVLEVQTGLPRDFVAARFSESSGIVGKCYVLFRNVRKSFQDGKMEEGNRQLVEAVGALKAFFEWWAAVMGLVPEEERARYDITEFVNELTEACKKICQQQLYQSWWALGETLKDELEPRLDKLEDHCRQFALQR
jgi:hypothetical protein